MSPDVTLYGHWTCPYVHRVAWALAERSIVHEHVDVPPSAVRPKDFVLPEEFVAHSPRLEIPMVRVGDDYLADSIPVLEWLEAVVPDAPPLLPRSDDEARLVRSRMAWIDAEVFRPMIEVYYGVADDRIADASARLSMKLGEMATWFERGSWLAGTGPTLADAVFVPFLVRREALGLLGFDGTVPAEIIEYGERVKASTGWAAVEWSTEQTDEIVGRFRARRRKAREKRAAESSAAPTAGGGS